MIESFVEALRTPAGIAFLSSLLAIPPLARMLRRAGLARGWALLALVPSLVGLTLVFAVLALKRWPTAVRKAEPA